MARRSRSSTPTARPGLLVTQRDAFDVSTSVLRNSPADQDGRYFYPQRSPFDYAPPRLISGARTRVEIRRVSRGTSRLAPSFSPSVPIGLQFPDKRTVVCVRRAQRRQVLFALKKRGKGSGSPKKYTRYSGVHCK